MAANGEKLYRWLSLNSFLDIENRYYYERTCGQLSKTTTLLRMPVLFHYPPAFSLAIDWFDALVHLPKDAE